MIGSISSFEQSTSTQKNDKLVDKINKFIEVPTFDQMNLSFVVDELKILAKILDININKDIKRTDGKKGAPKKENIIDYLLLQFNKRDWVESKDIMKQNWEKKKMQQ